MRLNQVVLRALRSAHGMQRSARNVRRAVLLLGVTGMISGAGLLAAGFALAANGSEPGNLHLNPASGPANTTPAAATTDGCPTGFQASAQLEEFNTIGTTASRISKVVPSPVAAFNLLLAGSIGDLLGSTDVTPGGTVEFAVGCYSQIAGTGSVKFVQATFVTLSADGTSYSTSASGPSGSPSPSSTPSVTPSVTPSGTPSVTPTPPPTSSAIPSGAPATGAGGASPPGHGSDLLIALGATLLAGSTTATGLAIRRARRLPAAGTPGTTRLGGS